MNILISSAGRRVSLVKFFKLELQKFGNENLVFTSDMSPNLSAACQIADNYFQVLPLSDPDFIDDLIVKCLQNKIKLIIPTLDSELLLFSKNLDKFKMGEINVVISTHDFIETCRDKRRTNLFFIQNQIEIPKQLEQDNLIFPVFIKPYDGSLSADIFVIRDKSQLTPYHLNNPKFMFMEYLDKKDYDEFTIDMYYGLDFNVKCIIPRKRIEVRGGEISKGLTCNNNLVQFLYDRLGYIEGARGCLTVQVFRDKLNGNVKGIEINPRFGGGYPLSYHAGGNFPKYIIEEYLLENEVSYFDKWENSLLMLRYDEAVLVHEYSS